MSVTDGILYDTLERLNGALLAGVIGADGLHVDMVVYDDDLPHESYDAEAELSALAVAASAAAERLNVAPLTTIILETSYMTYIIAAIVPGYYGVLGVQANSLGPARFALREMVERLLSEL